MLATLLFHFIPAVTDISMYQFSYFQHPVIKGLVVFSNIEILFTFTLLAANLLMLHNTMI